MQPASSRLFSADDAPALGLAIRHPRWPLNDLNREAQTLLAQENPKRRLACMGLALLWHDYWEEAHEKVQSCEGDPDCDWIHAILHRREGDLSNTRYWLTQVGNHESYPQIAAAMEAHIQNIETRPIFLKNGIWNPIAFAKCVVENPQDAFLKTMQGIELLTLVNLWWSQVH